QRHRCHGGASERAVYQRFSRHPDRRDYGARRRPRYPPGTITSVLDYSVRVSSREAYCSPTRDAQGNALKTLIAMPFALDGASGEVLIETKGIRHQIRFDVDHLRQEPRILHE